MITNPFSNGGSPTPDSLNQEARFTYVPTVSGTDITGQGDVLAATATLGHAQVATATGQCSRTAFIMASMALLGSHESSPFFKILEKLFSCWILHLYLTGFTCGDTAKNFHTLIELKGIFEFLEFQT